jgi:hypothetical protein
MSKKKDLYSQVGIPLPSKIPMIADSDSEKEVCAKIDAYFDDIIKCYPDSTQKFIRKMYYRDINIIPVGNLFETGFIGTRAFTTSFAIFQLFGIVLKQKSFSRSTMQIDSKFVGCPMLSRLQRIHEIAVHAGQWDQRQQQVGLRQCLNESENGTFPKFTEQSAAAAEKILIDALPDSVIKRDIAHISDVKTQHEIWNDMMIRKGFTRVDYIRLEHRGDTDNITETDHSIFMSRPEVQKLYGAPHIAPVSAKAGENKSQHSSGKEAMHTLARLKHLFEHQIMRGRRHKN